MGVLNEKRCKNLKKYICSIRSESISNLDYDYKVLEEVLLYLKDIIITKKRAGRPRIKPRVFDKKCVYSFLMYLESKKE